MRHSGRGVVPPDPAVAFIDALLEDYADEWLTKCMFHYRWAHAADIAKASAILPRWFSTDMPEEVFELMALYPQPMRTAPTVEYLPEPRPGHRPARP